MYVASSSSHQRQDNRRHDWVDVVRGIGIILVFYGHYVQQGIHPDNAGAIEQLRFIYSFHMPLFFVMSGFFFHPANNQALMRIYQLALRRIIPVVVFSLMLFPLWLRYEVNHVLPVWHDMARMELSYFTGRPGLNWVTWFLICLFLCETMAVFVLGKLQGMAWKITVAGILLILGLIFCSYSIAPGDGILYTIGRTWFFSEAIIALGFYIIGNAMFPLLKMLVPHRWKALSLFLVSLLAVWLTYDLNHPESVVVMMAAREHGNYALFVFTALAGSFAIFTLGIFIRSNHLLQVIGRNTLPLLGLNGLFFQYIDPNLVNLIQPGNSELSITLDSTLVTAVSLLMCIPVIYFLNRYLPQLVGKTRVAGPWLPALEPGRKV